VNGEQEHIIEAIGRCRIVVRDGAVVEVGPPLIERCPLARRFAFPVDEMTPEAVRENIEERIRSFGMCTKDRDVLSEDDFVAFGASELMSCGIRQGLLDCAVIVCDGAGTLVATNPALVQGIGGRMSGLVKTCPIPETIERIEQNGGTVLDHRTAAIDQAGGVALAVSLGHERIAVTTARADEAAALRRQCPEALIVGVHVTGLTVDEAEQMAEAADLVAVCASKAMREAAGRRALLQAGAAIPVFALSAAGKKLICARIEEMPQPFFVRSASLPAPGERSPEPLV
jgi:putative methanogenesis marker protein 8